MQFLTREPVALKVIDKRTLTQQTVQIILSEIEIMKKLSNPHILKLIEVVET